MKEAVLKCIWVSDTDHAISSRCHWLPFVMNGFCSILQFSLCNWKFDYMYILLKMQELEVPLCESAPRPLKLMEALSLALTDIETGPKKEQIMFGNVYK